MPSKLTPRQLLVTLWICALVVAACDDPRPPIEPHRGPIVLITFSAMRADVVGALDGALRLTPNLDRLAGEADWAGAAVAPSSWTPAATASLLTGLQPWKHQVVHGQPAQLRPELWALPEALAAVGYQTAGYWSLSSVSGKFGYGQGFAEYRALRQARRAAAHLSSLDGGPAFVWIQLPAPREPFHLRQALLSRLRRPREDLPELVTSHDLAAYFDPTVALPEDERERLWQLYSMNVAWADFRLGALLKALRESGHWDETLLVVTSDHGMEFGERDQIGYAGNLGRQSIEVPLVVKLPSTFPKAIAIEDGQSVGTVRVWSTLVEAAGGEVVPAAAPSLFEPGPVGVLSELYLGNGTNQFSWVSGSFQLHWSSRFAPAVPGYYRAVQAATAPDSDAGDIRRYAAIVAKLHSAFLDAPPLSGVDRSPELDIERWTQDGTRSVADPRLQRVMADELRAAWMEFLDEEHPQQSPPWPALGGGADDIAAGGR